MTKKSHYRRLLKQNIGFLVLLTFIGCSGGGSPSSTPTPPAPVVSITISPTSGSVQTGGTLQFSATVTNTTNLAVTWQVNGTTGGSASVGTISASGLYTAPATVPSPNTVTITTISSADSTKAATATVTITAPPISVTVSPTTATVRTLYTQQFTATVANSSNTAVNWSVNGTKGGSSDVGTISASGLYTAPISVPTPAAVTVTATSVADSTKSANAQVTVQPPPVPSGTWSYLGPGGSGFSAQLVADPRNAQTLYATPTYQGNIFKTTDLGKTWSQILPPGGLRITMLIAPASGTIYLFYSDHLQTSTDGGKTFSSAVTYPGGLNIQTSQFTFAVDPKNDQTLYLLSTSALLRSHDGGATWTSLAVPPNAYVSNGVNAPALGSFLVSSSNSSVLASATSTGIAISKDGGGTWQVQNAGLDPSFSRILQIVQDAVNPNRLLCLGGSASNPPYVYAYVSSDSGLTWTKIGSVTSYGSLISGQTGPGVYFESGGLFATFDGGVTYQNIGPPNDPTIYTAVLSPLTPNTIAYQGADDISVSQDGGKTWTVSESGINARVMGQVAYAGTSGPLYASTLLVNFPQFWRAADAGAAWGLPDKTYSHLPITQFDVDAGNPLHLVGIEQGSFTTLPETTVISSDGGATWTPIPYAPGMQDQFQPFTFSGIRFGAPGSNSAYGCGNFGVARLSTVTNIWTIINNGIAAAAACTAIGIDRKTVGTLYATTSSGVYKSVDGGNNWSLLFQNSASYQTVLVDPKNSKNIFLSGGSSMRSTDGGTTWSPMAVGGVMVMHPTNPNLMYAISPSSLSASSDAGMTWGQISYPNGNFEDVTVTTSGVVVISTLGSGLLAFTPN